MDRKQYGTSLLELLTSLTIAAILISYAVPGMMQFKEKWQADIVQSEIQRLVSYARYAAVRDGVTVTVCGTNDGFSCVKKNFSDVVVFLDRNKNGEIERSKHDNISNEKILHHSTFKGLVFSELKAGFGRPFIRFTKFGRTEQTGSFHICTSKKPRSARRITVNNSGRNYLGRKDKAGNVRQASGNAISC